MIWSFLWRFAVASVLIGFVLTRVAGFLTGVSGGGALDALHAGYWAEGLSALLGAVLALGSVQNRAREQRT